MSRFSIGFPSFLNTYVRSRNNRSLKATDWGWSFALPAITLTHSGL